MHAAKCDTSVGFNSLFEPKYCRFYSEEEMALAYLIREIQLCGGLIDGFSMHGGTGLHCLFCLYRLRYFLLVSLYILYSVPTVACYL